MNNTQWFHARSGLLVVAGVMAISVSAGARAEYLCNAPASPADQRACELAKKDSPRELYHYILRTKTIYGLYMPDYIAPSDVKRWDLARSGEGNRAVTVIEMKQKEQSATR